MILSPVIRQRYFDSNGNPLAGGKLYSYAAGTTTPQVTYSDQAGTSNTNPLILDASGEADLWLDATLSYKFVLKNSTDVVQWTKDQVAIVSLTGSPKWAISSTYAQGDIVADASGFGLLYVSLQSNNTGNVLTSVAFWRAFAGNVRTLTANTTLVVTDDMIRSNSTAGALTHTLPACSTTAIGKRITIKDVGTGGFATTVRGNGTDQVDGVVTYGTALSLNDSLTVINSGTAWSVLNPAIPDGGIATVKLAAGVVTHAKLAVRATGTTVAAGGVAVSTTTGTIGFGQVTSSTFGDVTNLSVTITTTGRPVIVTMIPDAQAATSGSYVGTIHSFGAASGTWAVRYLRDASSIVEWGDSTFSAVLSIPVGAFSFTDMPSAGTYTYKVQARAFSGAFRFCGAKLIAYEL